MADNIADVLGADLPVTDLGFNGEAAPDGFSKDSLGNLYETPRQGAGQAKDAGGTAPDAGAQQTATGQQAGTGTATNTGPDMAAVEAARAEAQAARQLANSLLVREQAREQAAWEARVRQLPEAQQRIAVQQRQVQLQAQQVQAAQARYQQQQAAAEPFMKGVAVDLLTKEFGDKISLPADALKASLSRCKTPEAMEDLCNTLVAMSSDATLQQRAKSGVDAAATAGSGTTRPASSTQSWKSQSLRAQLASAFQ